MQPDEQHDHAEDGDDGTGHDASPGGLDLRSLVVGESGHGWDANGPSSRADGRKHGDADSDDDGGDSRMGQEHETVGRQRDAEGLEQCFDAQRTENAQPEADQRGHETNDGRLGQHGSKDLSSTGADHPQQRQLAGALSDDDREGVEDGEGPDEEGDEGKDQKSRREEPKCLVDLIDHFVGHRLTSHHLGARRQDGRDGMPERGLVDARISQDVDGVVLAGHVEHGLSGGEVECSQRGAGQIVGRAEADDGTDGEGLRRTLEEDPHVFSHPEVVLLGGGLVHGHLVSGRRGRSLHHSEGRELGIGDEGRADGRGSAGRDRLPVGCHKLRKATHGPLGHGHPRHSAHRGRHRLGNRVASGAPRAVAGQCGRAPHLEVDVLVDAPEEGRERAVQRVGEHQGAGHERDPEHDGETSEGEPELVGQQPLHGDFPHGQLPMSFMRSKIESGVGDRSSATT